MWLQNNLLFYIILFGLIFFSILIDIKLSDQKLNLKSAVGQIMIWTIFTALFGYILWHYKGNEIALKYFSGYVIEMSLSVDNVFVFILIFKSYKIKDTDSKKLLLIGILCAIVLRIFFIAAGIELIDRFEWIMYVFGPFLIYTGIKVMRENEEKELKENKILLRIKNKLRFNLDINPHGKYFVIKNNKFFFTTLSFVVVLLAFTDFIFALDSIPTIISIVKTDPHRAFSQDEILVVYASNIFAILSLRSLFIILQNMSKSLHYLQNGIGIILVFVGLKMLAMLVNFHISVLLSLVIIFGIIFLSVILSLLTSPKKKIL